MAVVGAGHPLARLDAIPVARLAGEPFVAYPSHFRSTLHDAVEDVCARHGFAPTVALEVSETATLVSFVAAGIGISLVPESVTRLAVEGAIYRPLADEPVRVELAHRREDDNPVLVRALAVIRAALA